MDGICSLQLLNPLQSAAFPVSTGWQVAVARQGFLNKSVSLASPVQDDTGLLQYSSVQSQFDLKITSKSILKIKMLVVVLEFSICLHLKAVHVTTSTGLPLLFSKGMCVTSCAINKGLLIYVLGGNSILYLLEVNLRIQFPV